MYSERLTAISSNGVVTMIAYYFEQWLFWLQPRHDGVCLAVIVVAAMSDGDGIVIIVAAATNERSPSV